MRKETRSDGHRIFDAQGNIRRVIFAASTGRLLVEFKGGSTYVYTDVPESAYEALLGAEELQRAFNDVVKGGGFAFERLAS